MHNLLTLNSDDIILEVVPGIGGGVSKFQWRGLEIFRRGLVNGDPLSLSSFALMPFANRIANGVIGESGFEIPPNNSAVDPKNPIHGYAWMAPWEVIEVEQGNASLRHAHMNQVWPWNYCAEQKFSLFDKGFEQRLCLTNKGRIPMPSGLGLHPYLPRANSHLKLVAKGVWDNGEDGLPKRWRQISSSIDWLSDSQFDNVVTGRRGSIVIDWPTHRLVIEPDTDLSFTHVYTPLGEDYFCVEPVSHMPNAINRGEPAEQTGLRWLEPEETWQTSVRFTVEGLD